MPTYKITETYKTHPENQPSRLDQIIKLEFQHRLKTGASMMIAPQGGNKFEELTYGYGNYSIVSEHRLYRGKEIITIPYEQLFQSFKAGFFAQTSSLADIEPLKGSYISGFRDQNGQEYLITNETATPNSNYEKLLNLTALLKDEKQKPPKPSSTISVLSDEKRSSSSRALDTCYSILGVKPTASQEEIQSAYVATKDPEVNESFRILSNPSKKLIYDHHLKTYQDHAVAKWKAKSIRSEKSTQVIPQSQEDFLIYKIHSSAKATIKQLSELELEERLDYSEEHNTPFICERYRGVHEEFEEESGFHTFRQIIKTDRALFKIPHSLLVQSFQNELFPRVPANDPYAQTPLPDETLYGGLLTENEQIYYVVHVHKNNQEALNLIQQLAQNSYALIQKPSLEDRKEQPIIQNPPPQEPADKYQCLKKYGLFACVGIGATVIATTVITVNVQMALCLAALVNAKNEALLKGSLGQSSLHRIGEINAGSAVGIAIDMLVLVACYAWYKHSKSSELVSLTENSRLKLH